jgi:putative transcriptional regulator
MTGADLDALLVDYVLGTLGEEERKQIDARLETDAELMANLLGVEEALAAVAWAQAPLEPPVSGRARLMEATRSEETPSFFFVDRLARFFDLAANEVRMLLSKAASPAAWEKGPMPGMELFHLSAGPRWAGCDAGLIRFEGGVAFPMHSHVGEEHTLMLDGGFTLDDGTQLVSGQEMSMAPGSSHAYTVNAGGCRFALILRGGVDIPGVGRLGTRS